MMINTKLWRSWMQMPGSRYLYWWYVVTKAGGSQWHRDQQPAQGLWWVEARGPLRPPPLTRVIQFWQLTSMYNDIHNDWRCIYYSLLLAESTYRLPTLYDTKCLNMQWRMPWQLMATFYIQILWISLYIDVNIGDPYPPHIDTGWAWQKPSSRPGQGALTGGCWGPRFPTHGTAPSWLQSLCCSYLDIRKSRDFKGIIPPKVCCIGTPVWIFCRSGHCMLAGASLLPLSPPAAWLRQ